MGDTVLGGLLVGVKRVPVAYRVKIKKGVGSGVRETFRGVRVWGRAGLTRPHGRRRRRLPRHPRWGGRSGWWASGAACPR